MFLYKVFCIQVDNILDNLVNDISNTVGAYIL